MIKLITRSRFRRVCRPYSHKFDRSNTFRCSGFYHRYHTSKTLSQEDELVQSLVSSTDDSNLPPRIYELNFKGNTKTSSPSIVPSRTTGPTSRCNEVHPQTSKTAPTVCSTSGSGGASPVKPAPLDYVVESNRFVSVRRQDFSQGHYIPEVQWKCCRCQNFNSIEVKTCTHCKSDAAESYRKKFPPSRQITLFPPVWICEECGNKNDASQNTSSTSTEHISNLWWAQRSKFFCEKCQSPFKGVRKWTCSFCDSVNSRASAQCSTCFHVRLPGWKCKKCNGAPNSIFSLQCISCRNLRPSRVSKGTKQCANCGETNDIRSELCESCVAPLQELQSLFLSSLKHIGSSLPAPVPGLKPVLQKELKALSNTSCGEASLGQHADSAQDKSLTEKDGSWWCENCNIILRRNATFCDICLTPRGGVFGSKSGKGTNTSLSHQPQPGDWQCPYCRQFNGINVRSCCGKERECPAGYWLCANCASINRNERHLCLGCGHAPSQTMWKCKVCGTSNSVHIFTCETCVSPHPLLWSCPKCRKSYHYTFSKCECGMSRPDSPSAVICPLCGAPNAKKRKSCFRCRGRLFSDQWKCLKCHYEKNSRIVYRCEQCLSARPFHIEGITWVCDVCSTAVDSGGDLPERLQCPKCNSQYTSHCLKFPSRWICKGCRLEANRATSPTCMECGRNRMLAPFKCPAVCPHCFQDTVLTENEVCSLCGGSLSALLNAPGEVVQGMETKVIRKMRSD